MRLLDCTTAPAARKGNRIHRVARWFTWSGFRQAVPEILAAARRDGVKPCIAKISGLHRYDYTFSASGSAQGRSFREKLRPWAEALRRLPVGSKIWLMRGLLLPGMDSFDLRLLLTGFRDALAVDGQESSSALYAPLVDTGGAPKEFPLHCDLYVPKPLWNIFDDVPAEGRSGASIFLSTTKMLRLARDCGVGQAQRVELRAHLQAGEGDRYDAFYKLLYGDSIPLARLDCRMRAAMYRLRLLRGEAYLINDRLWM